MVARGWVPRKDLGIYLRELAEGGSDKLVARLAPQTDKTCILPITIAEDLARSLTHYQTTVNRQLALTSCF